MILLKYISKCRYRKGFTLTELIVVVALIAMIMATVAAFSGPVNKLISNVNAKSDAVTINKGIGDYIERRLAYANYVDIYVGVPFVDGASSDPGYSKMLNSIQNIQKFMDLHGQVQSVGGVTTYKEDQQNNARVMIFHFEPDKYESFKNTFKVYDIPLKHNTFTTGMKFEDFMGDAHTDNLVFTDDFYAGYQYFFTIDDPDPKSYLTLHIDSFNIINGADDGTTIRGINADDAANYHKYIDSVVKEKKGVLGVTALSNPMDKFIYERTASDDVTFRFENLSKVSYNIYYGTDKTDGISDFGSDIYIFYNVRTYRTDKDRLSYT